MLFVYGFRDTRGVYAAARSRVRLRLAKREIQ